MSGKRYPLQKRENPRVEVNVLKVDADGNSIYDEEFDPDICHCFPSTSSKRLPSMIYDGLKCDHHYTQHIQPAQNSVFTYPWTANTVRGRDNSIEDDRDSLKSEKLSMIAEEPSVQDVHVTRTAPPFASPSKTVERTKGPFSAPVDSRWESHGPDFRRFKSEQRLYTGGRPRSLDSREFRGRYIDPKDGQVYNFNVNYGKRSVQASRQADNTLRHSPVEYR